ncbi:MAG TPA: response regulator [Methylomirabilota bacterium]|nr:response regulator [Methylomirabilota bacterium]
MAAKKILLLDDDAAVLELYQELFGKLPSKPEVKVAGTGARAIALLESEPFTLLLCDLNMPKMDGLQVLAIVRRRFPQVRTVAFTAVADEHIRARAYGMGVDMFLEKPTTTQEVQHMLDCLESLLTKEEEGGFRGVQSKSLVDIIQLECLSQNSGLLKITNGPSTGKIWIQNGEIIDAEAGDDTGDQAFQKIMGWKGGTFEMLPPDPKRTRVIFNSYQGLLLESAQALDEAQQSGGETSGAEQGTASKASPLSEIGRIKEVEFALAISADGATHPWGLENPEKLTSWMSNSVRALRRLGDRLKVGELQDFVGVTPERRLGITLAGKDGICLGLNKGISDDDARAALKKAAGVWGS